MSEFEQRIVTVNVRGLPANCKDVVYCGRKCGLWEQAVLGNKHNLPQDDRDVRITKFRKELGEAMKNPNSIMREEILELARRVRSGEVVKLGCWCKPLACHTDVIKNCILWVLKNNLDQEQVA